MNGRQTQASYQQFRAATPARVDRFSNERQQPPPKVIVLDRVQMKEISKTQMLLLLCTVISILEAATSRSIFHYPGYLVAAICVAYCFGKRYQLVQFLTETILVAGLTASLFYYLSFYEPGLWPYHKYVVTADLIIKVRPFNILGYRIRYRCVRQVQPNSSTNDKVRMIDFTVTLYFALDHSR